MQQSFPRVISAHLRSDGAESLLLREMAPGLFVGSAASVHVLPSSVAVVQLAPEVAAAQGPRARLRVPIRDGDPVLPEVVRAVLDFVAAHRRHGVLLQCFAGLSRSASLAYAALRLHDGLTHAEAYRRISLRVPRRDGSAEIWPHPRTFDSVARYVDAQLSHRGAIQ